MDKEWLINIRMFVVLITWGKRKLYREMLHKAYNTRTLIVLQTCNVERHRAKYVNARQMGNLTYDSEKIVYDSIFYVSVIQLWLSYEVLKILS